MGRRTVLLVVALVVAMMGSGMVYLYVKNADSRAREGQELVQVLKAVAQIDQGESLIAAQTAGKLQQDTVPRSQLLDGAMSEVDTETEVFATQTLFPNEQIIISKFNETASAGRLALQDGEVAISVNLSDTGRVAGFVSPGSNVAIYFSGPVTPDEVDGVRLLLPEARVVAVAQETVGASTDPDTGQPVEALPRSLFTLALSQTDAEKVIYASSRGELTFAVTGEKSDLKPQGPTTPDNLFG